MDKTIAFIGGGNMAEALLGGLCAAGHPPDRLRVADPDAARRGRLAAGLKLRAEARNLDAAAGADIVVLAVKPQVMAPVLAELAGHLHRRSLVISVAAGIPLSRLQRGLAGPDGEATVSLVRAMPNTPALFGAGVTGLVANAAVDSQAREAAAAVFAPAGEVVWLADESLMDAVTAVSGSGPAYFFLLTEALAAAGEAQGLPADVAARLALHTAHGAGVMLRDSGADATELRRRVTSPGGTTEAALATLEAGGLRELLAAAVDAAVARGRELGDD